MTTNVVVTPEETNPEIIKLKGCPNCGAEWRESKPDLNCVIWFQAPGKAKAGLELCPGCFYRSRRRIKKRAIMTTVRGLGRNSNKNPKWSRPEILAFEIALDKFLTGR